jgi:hypothetical protein
MLNREDKEKLLEIFNTKLHGPWTPEYSRRFMENYKALAASMTSPILKKIDNSELRKSIKVIKSPRVLDHAERRIIPIKVKPGTPYLPEMGSWDAETADDSGTISVFPLAAACEVRLGKVTIENVEKMMKQISTAIINYEVEAVNKLKDAANIDDVVLYVRKDYEPYDDPTILKRQSIGVFGWEEIAVAAE